MMKAKRYHLAFSVLLIAILACNAPGGQQLSPSDLAATITAQAQTLQAPTSPADTQAIAAASTPSGAEVSVTSATNCRTGPSTAYDLIFTMNPGQTVPVVGKNTQTNYWIINNPTGGTCWLWGQNAVVTGDTASLPEYPSPPPPPTSPPKATKTPKPTKTPTETSSGNPPKPILTFKPIFTLVLLLPTAPTNLAQNRSCSEYFQGLTPKWKEEVTLTWQASANQTGYKIYKNGSSISTIPATSTSYHITLNYDVGTGGPLYDNFGVEAYNSGGASQRPSIDVPRCP